MCQSVTQQARLIGNPERVCDHILLYVTILFRLRLKRGKHLGHRGRKQVERLEQNDSKCTGF